MFRTVPLSIIRGFSLYTQQWYMSYSFVDSLRAGSGWNSVLILFASCQQTCMTYTIAVCTVKTPDDGQRNCPKHIKFYSKNKFEKLVHLVVFIIRIYHDARSPERQIHINTFINFRSSCVVINVRSIVRLWFSYYTRRVMISIANFRSVNSVANCGPQCSVS